MKKWPILFLSEVFISHQPVLLQEVLSLFAECRLTTFVDGTVGAGGHAAALLDAHPEIVRFYGVDRDPSALKLAAEVLAPFGDKVQLIHTSYAQIGEIVESCEGILLDIGVSSMQLDQGERGFSFLRDGPLDMRMDSTQKLDARYVVNRYSEKKLGEIIRDYGEERRWRQVAKVLCEARQRRALATTGELVKVLEPLLGKSRGPIHPATRIFQALRIEVNQELEQLKQGIAKAYDLLTVGGRLVIITFHSLEDRIVKHLFKERKDMKVLTKKPLTASISEQKSNRRARSAKVRCVEKI